MSLNKTLCPLLSTDSTEIIWASMRENLSPEVCEHHRRRPACPTGQSDQCLCYSFFLKSIIPNLVTGEISIFWLVAEETGLELAFSVTLKTCFHATWPISYF